ncbi:hypothetical protein [Spodoptera cosmioides nucleopolyhedrovirus]|uniref:Uncharacterized protein n=1 Tax=Spodoptera cosmioides nucleopolyhedrovirus TaxID=2605774 RepID=A0A6B7KSZ6_9ABAC|nr:hypothetical protein [Spodoptera cosmioides nucleopolyhedrovirus]
MTQYSVFIASSFCSHVALISVTFRLVCSDSTTCVIGSVLDLCFHRRSWTKANIKY